MEKDDITQTLYDLIETVFSKVKEGKVVIKDGFGRVLESIEDITDAILSGKFTIGEKDD